MLHTPNLTLPYIAPAQAQKHVTYNEAIRALDAVVQLSAVSRSVAAEPAAPPEGARYILPAGKTGPAWGAMAAGDIAAWQDGAWTAISPRPGFLAWIGDEETLLVRSGGEWTPATSGGGAAETARRVDGLTPHENLRVKRAGAGTVDIDADAAVVFTAAGASKRLVGLDLTANIAGAGANGLDAGAEASSRWYHLWVIWNGVAAASLISESASAPALPAGYTHKGYVGAVYNDAGGDFVNFTQSGASVSTASTSVVAAGAAASLTAVDLAAAVPANARDVLLDVYAYRTAGSSRVWAMINPQNADPSLYSIFVNNPASAVVGTGGAIQLQNRVPLPTSQTIWYKVAGGVNAATYIYALGYSF